MIMVMVMLMIIEWSIKFLYREYMDIFNFRHAFILLGFFLILLCAEPVFPGPNTVTRGMSFGDVVVSPSGDVIELDARFGPDEEASVLTNGNTIVKGGHSGAFTVVSDMAGQQINIIYPNSVTLTASPSSDTVTLTGMNVRSKTYDVSSRAGEEINFDIGGWLQIPSGQAGKLYSGTITVNIDFVNP